MSLEEIVTTVKTLWRFDYEPHVKALRDLYEVAKREQWNAATDIPWELESDPAAVGTLFPRDQDPLNELDFIQNLPAQTRVELNKRRSAWLLSQFLHGEQGAMMCASQLVEAVPDMDGKLYAATQVIDEARHVEVFARYITRLDKIYPIMPNLKTVLNAVLEADLWQMKCVGMQVIAEGLAMGSFKMMREATGDEVLRRVVELTSQDEARHVSYGLIYMREELARMDEASRNRIEDFAWTAVDLLAGRRNAAGNVPPLFHMMGELGLDTGALLKEVQEKFGDPRRFADRPNPVRDYVIPNLQRINVITERTAPNYRALGLAA
ncbi:MAG: ferritin-like domain-containing protein [Myxococcota bacterium]|jgi:hypothetical protein|nr:ferritin-like domain-containing protein [Myxococcota bacterium]